MPQQSRHESPSTGFTLVELLVVIGIIAVLVGILLPALSAARRQANLLKCQSNIRQVTEACLLRAHDSKGWLPLAGQIVPDPARVRNGLAEALGDTYRTRYVYAQAPAMGGNVALVPLPGAIGRYFGMKNLDFSDWDVLDQQLNDRDHGAWRMFMCPATDSYDKMRKAPTFAGDSTPYDQATLLGVFVGASQWAWSTNTDFVLNEGVLGFYYMPQYGHLRLAGKLTKMKAPSQVCLLTDGKRRNTQVTSWAQDGWATWTPSFIVPGPFTLGRALDNSGAVSDKSSFDTTRHKGRINVGFVDGHVETLQITTRDLQKVYVLPPTSR